TSSHVFHFVVSIWPARLAGDRQAAAVSAATGVSVVVRATRRADSIERSACSQHGTADRPHGQRCREPPHAGRSGFLSAHTSRFRTFDGAGASGGGRFPEHPLGSAWAGRSTPDPERRPVSYRAGRLDHPGPPTG